MRHPVCFVLDMHMHHVFLDWTDESRTCMRYDELGFCLLLRCEWAWASSYGDVCFTLTQASRCMHSWCLLSSSREGGIHTCSPYKTYLLSPCSFFLSFSSPSASTPIPYPYISTNAALRLDTSVRSNVQDNNLHMHSLRPQIDTSTNPLPSRRNNREEM
jgi:hypothetical protein